LWPQRVLASFTPATGARVKYAATAGKPATLAGRDLDGQAVSEAGLEFDGESSETFVVPAPADAGIVLRKRFLLDKAGFEAKVAVNGKALDRAWNLKHAEAELNEGLRDADFVVDAAEIAAAPKLATAGVPGVQITVTYKGKANSLGWTVLEYRGGTFPLSALGPLHANQAAGRPRLARNTVGAPLRIGQTNFANGIGAFANSLVEYPVNGQFKRFRAKAGVDAATDGRGSVVFEVWADGKKRWSSPLTTGLDAPREVDVDLAGVDRLRLIVTDGGDGNRYDAADWCDPVLER
ncbi:MAG: NPCBM/NEW2 domain-containing protein, partial [Planctomycetota bacterium]|nr:NPCBM/NEW2 domain-containing protein [Planctomycetota bacterium]